MTDATPDVSVVDVPKRSRFEITVDGELAGICQYSLDGEVITLTHTEIYDGHEGQGLAGRLVRAALDSARDSGLRVCPECPYAASYIAKHPDYNDLVA